MATTLQWHPQAQAVPLPARAKPLNKFPTSARHVATTVQAFRRSDIDGFAKRMASGEAWRDAWRSANDGFERFVFEARKTAERLDRRYALSRKLSSATQSAAARAREIDRELEISSRWRAFSVDFSRNWPRVCSAVSFSLRLKIEGFLLFCAYLRFLEQFFVWLLSVQYRKQINDFLDTPLGRGFAVSN